MQKIFGSGTMRTGGTLVCNIFSLSNNNHVFTEIIYFARHLNGKYKDFDKYSTLYKIASEFCLRLRYKNLIRCDYKDLLQILIKSKIKNINDLYECIIFFLLKINNIKKKKNIIEYSNGEWRFIDKFLQLDKKNKAFHVIRDPRAVISSFKRMTFEKGNNFWYSLFNWIDSYNELKILLKKYNKKRFLNLQFESLHLNPIKNINKILKFSNTNNLSKIDLKVWEKKLKNSNSYINFSSYDYKKKIGFSINRINAWNNYLKDYEVCLIEFLLNKQMKNLGYKFSSFKNKKKLAIIGLGILKRNKNLKIRLDNYLKSNKGSEKRISDPQNFKNWGSASTPNKKFIHDKNYTFFLTEKNIIDQNVKFLKETEI